jgi:type VI protein secretion system component Hcp
MSSVAKLYLMLRKTNADGAIIPGESVAEGFEQQIELDDWSWSLTRPQGETTPTVKMGAGALFNPNAAVPSVFAFSKHMDRATTAMLSAARSGELLHATLTLEESSDADFEMVIRMEKVRVISYDMNAQNEKASALAEENWQFNYESIYFDYKPNAKSGTIRIKLDRHPGASTAAPSGDGSMLMEVAEKFTLKELEGFWPKIRAAAEKRLTDNTVPEGTSTH